jgi:hypothetical protein
VGIRDLVWLKKGHLPVGSCPLQGFPLELLQPNRQIILLQVNSGHGVKRKQVGKERKSTGKTGLGEVSFRTEQEGREEKKRNRR